MLFQAQDPSGRRPVTGASVCRPLYLLLRKKIAIVTLTQEEMDQKIDEHFGFEARDDVEGVLTTLAPDVTHDIVGFPAGPTHGRENARPFYETLFADLEEGKVT